MAVYRHANGVEREIDLDASGPIMREQYDRQIAAGELTLVESAPKPVAKKQAAKPAPETD